MRACNLFNIGKQTLLLKLNVTEIYIKHKKSQTFFIHLVGLGQQSDYKRCNKDSNFHTLPLEDTYTAAKGRGVMAHR